MKRIILALSVCLISCSAYEEPKEKILTPDKMKVGGTYDHQKQSIRESRIDIEWILE